VNLSRLIYRHSVLFFAFVAVAALLGFWPGYLSRIRGHDFLVHVHGVLLSLWLLMLISQAYLIRTNRRELHRLIGKLSYVVAPLVLISIATIRHSAMNRSDPATHSRFMLCTLIPSAGPIFNRVMSMSFPLFSD
jgi:hypothetical protein